MRITIIGTGYVGLVTGVCLAEIGHDVICMDYDKLKIKEMMKGISPIYEPGLEEMMKRNLQQGRLTFTTSYDEGLENAEIIYFAVGTPPNGDGTADLSYVKSVALEISKKIKHYVVLVLKSTVPVGTTNYMKQYITENLNHPCNFDIVSNPEFLREGSAIHDSFNGDRIIIGTESNKASRIMEEVYRPLNIPIYITDISSSEMIKYASNAFLATKISFINEIANICEKVGADVEFVAEGMGYDKRIGRHFLNAGIGYGGSCFPKDTKALVQIAGNVQHDFELLKSVIKVNNNQQETLVRKVKKRLENLKGKKIAILGLAFKPNTDDMREAASIVITEMLINEGALIYAYDKVAMNNAKKYLNPKVNYADSIKEAIYGADCVIILTDWDEIKEFDLSYYKKTMNTPIVFDGRNCYSLNAATEKEIEYHSIGRGSIIPLI